MCSIILLDVEKMHRAEIQFRNIWLDIKMQMIIIGDEFKPEMKPID